MTRWFLIFITSLLIVLGARYGTYSSLPAKVFVDCETPVIENKLLGLWELDRIDNYEAFHEALAENSGFLSSNSEARRALVENSISINKNKVDQNYIVSEKDLIRNKYVIINRGKKKTFILKAKV